MIREKDQNVLRINIALSIFNKLQDLSTQWADQLEQFKQDQKYIKADTIYDSVLVEYLGRLPYSSRDSLAKSLSALFHRHSLPSSRSLFRLTRPSSLYQQNLLRDPHLLLNNLSTQLCKNIPVILD